MFSASLAHPASFPKLHLAIVSDENVLNLHVGIDWNDTNTVNETGKHAGRHMYRTPEERGGTIGNDGNSARINGGSGGVVSVADLKTGETKKVIGRADWKALDGIVRTVWHTALTARCGSLKTTTQASRNGGFINA